MNNKTAQIIIQIKRQVILNDAHYSVQQLIANWRRIFYWQCQLYHRNSRGSKNLHVLLLTLAQNTFQGCSSCMSRIVGHGKVTHVLLL